jgi:DMSO/TMAO reductase YedYZ molybdopterin-dependent catalytic subunit
MSRRPNKLFIRNNGQVPDVTGDPKAWKLKIDGEVNTPMEISVGDLMTKFPAVTYQLMLECGGNGRSFFTPEARGNQWTNGGAGCPMWTGVRLADVLKAAGLKPSAVYTGSYGADPTLAGETNKPSISRGVPIAKAMEEHSLIAFKLNGQDLPLIHGAPVRLVIPGWPASASTKWLNRIWIRDKEHDGPGMGGFSYRVPKTPIVPGSKGNDKDMAILESMPVRSVITFPADGTRLTSRKLDLRGHAWAGDFDIKTVDISTDYGVTWKPAKVDAPANKYAWQNFSALDRTADRWLLRSLGQGDRQQGSDPALPGRQLEPTGLRGQSDQPHPRARRILTRLSVIHAAVIGLTATFLLLAFDRAGELPRDKYVYVPPAPKVAAAPPAVDPDKGKAPAAQRHGRGPSRGQEPRPSPFTPARPAMVSR